MFSLLTCYVNYCCHKSSTNRNIYSLLMPAILLAVKLISVQIHNSVGIVHEVPMGESEETIERNMEIKAKNTTGEDKAKYR